MWESGEQNCHNVTYHAKDEMEESQKARKLERRGEERERGGESESVYTNKHLQNLNIIVKKSVLHTPFAT